MRSKPTDRRPSCYTPGMPSCPSASVFEGPNVGGRSNLITGSNAAGFGHYTRTGREKHVKVKAPPGDNSPAAKLCPTPGFKPEEIFRPPPTGVGRGSDQHLVTLLSLSWHLGLNLNANSESQSVTKSCLESWTALVDSLPDSDSRAPLAAIPPFTAYWILDPIFCNSARIRTKKKPPSQREIRHRNGPL